MITQLPYYCFTAYDKFNVQHTVHILSMYVES